MPLKCVNTAIAGFLPSKFKKTKQPFYQPTTSNNICSLFWAKEVKIPICQSPPSADFHTNTCSNKIFLLELKMKESISISAAFN